MNVAMEAQKQNASSSSSTPDVLPPEDHEDALTHHSPHNGIVIPNRIFVGGIDYKVNESDLRHVFSQHGAVKEVKIVIDRSGMSKGYGFVTFETQADVLKILHDGNGICFKDKKLNIGQAVRKQQAPGQNKSAPVTSPDCATAVPKSCGTPYQTTSTGSWCSYGVAHFHSPPVNHPLHHWPQPATPVMLPQSHQSSYRQPAYHHYQCAPNQYHWNVIQPPMPSSPFMYPQLSEYPYQPADVQLPLPVTEDTTQEIIEPTMQLYPLIPQRLEGMTPVVVQHGPGKNQMFPFSHVRLKPKYHQHANWKDHHYLPEATEPPDDSVSYTSRTLM